MQLFGLVNTLLTADAETFQRRLAIHRYPVIPLSPNSGLIGWVPNCDTLHALIRDHREGHKVLLNVEHRVMHQVRPLPSPQHRRSVCVRMGGRRRCVWAWADGLYVAVVGGWIDGER
jgi:phosphatidylinositol kinase/protein kinase (PI-3  family)